jgi:hypothetical protein
MYNRLKNCLQYAVFGLLALLIMASSCRKPEVDNIPVISFKSIDKVFDEKTQDTVASLTIHFQDGDGDIGLGDSDRQAPFDTASPYFNNWFISFYEKQNGQFIRIDSVYVPGDNKFIKLNHNVRIPRLSNSYPESIEGEISYNELIYNNLNSPYDTVRFECYIVDRALNHSNTITTSELIVKKR